MTPLGWIFLICLARLRLGADDLCYHRVLTAPGEIEKPPDMLGG